MSSALRCGRRVVAAVELHEVRAAVARRELDEAQPVAIDVEPKRLGVDGDARTEGEAGRQIVLVQGDGGFSHRAGPSAIALALRGCDGQPSRIRLKALGSVHRSGLGRRNKGAQRRGTRQVLIEMAGAQERTRTSTPLRAPAPEAGASTNSATWARADELESAAPLVNYVPCGRAHPSQARGASCIPRLIGARGGRRREEEPAMADRLDDQGLATVFGGSGFVGRYAVTALAKQGWRVRAAVRRPDLAGFLQTGRLRRAGGAGAGQRALSRSRCSGRSPAPRSSSTPSAC